MAIKLTKSWYYLVVVLWIIGYIIVIFFAFNYHPFTAKERILSEEYGIVKIKGDTNRIDILKYSLYSGYINSTNNKTLFMPVDFFNYSEDIDFYNVNLTLYNKDNSPIINAVVEVQFYDIKGDMVAYKYDTLEFFPPTHSWYASVNILKSENYFKHIHHVNFRVSGLEKL